MAENLAVLCSSVLCKLELFVSDKLGYLRRFLSKVLKMQLDFSLLLIVKCERREREIEEVTKT